MEQIDPEMLNQIPIRFNEQQIRMLNTFKEEWPEEDFAEIRRTIVKVLARKIDEEWEKLEKERDWTQETYDGWLNEHMRTPYGDACWLD